MKKLLVLLLVLNSIQLFSQVDAKAKSILDITSEKTKNYPSITATFEFTMQNDGAGLKETTNGTLILQKEKYKLSLNGVDIFSDGKIQTTYMKEAQEANITEAGTDEESINPATIFTIYEKGYKNTYLGEFTNGQKKTYKIELTPLETKEFSRLIIEIDQLTYQILNAKMFGKDDNYYIIKVLSMITTKTYEPSTFVFDKKQNPKVEVIDMR
jgi:outer membrane lipoprotein-sorting protein